MADQELEIFKGISAADRAAIDKVSEKQSFAPGTIILKQGDPGGSMLIILSGRVEILRPKRKEGEFDVAAVLEAGQVVGEASLLGNAPRNATVRAKDQTEVLVVDKNSVGKLKRDTPSALIGLYESMLLQISMRFRGLSDKKDVFSFWLG